jgi:4-amino-4-deoxy-L-arabinose transferase-like glycosyltransferase
MTRRLYLLVAVVFVLGLLVAVRVYHQYDVVDCFLAWARASGGTRPWGVYTPGAGADACDYPALVPYLLTLAEAGRQGLGAAAVSATAVLLLKLPGLLAHLAAVPLAGLGLRGPLGKAHAGRAAALLALCPALFVNSAAWGQFDVLLALFLLAALVALLRGGVWAGGAALGLALATKLLAIVVVPLMGLYVGLRFGFKKLAAWAGAGLLVVLLLTLPHVLGGAGRSVLAAYAGAVNYYPYRTAEAYNTWYVLDRYDVLVRGLSPPLARRDDRPALGPLTFHHLGLLAFGAYTVLLMTVLGRRPTPPVLLWTLGLQLFAFFMLPTQVHQRYIVPAVAFLAVLAPLSPRALVLFLGVTVTATLNQGLDLVRALPTEAAIAGALTTADLPLATRTARDLGAGIALVNVALFAFATWAFWREVVLPGPAAPVLADADP